MSNRKSKYLEQKRVNEKRDREETAIKTDRFLKMTEDRLARTQREKYNIFGGE